MTAITIQSRSGTDVHILREKVRTVTSLPADLVRVRSMPPAALPARRARRPPRIDAARASAAAQVAPRLVPLHVTPPAPYSAFTASTYIATGLHPNQPPIQPKFIDRKTFDVNLVPKRLALYDLCHWRAVYSKLVNY